jgi:hypothetical protein
MKKLFFTVLGAASLIAPSTLFAQDDDDHNTQIIGEDYSILSTDSTYEDVGLIPEVLDENVRALLQSWHAKYFSQSDPYCIDHDENAPVSDDVYRDRLSRMATIIPMDYNPIVRNCISIYADRRRELVRYVMAMADLYFPLFEQVLDQYDLPLELKYLAIIESNLNPRAYSRAGAAGIWQFMLPTGKLFGLEINSLIDQRLDPIASTHAACKYFKQMYATFGDWYLVLASYNCGPGNVNKAIRRAGGRTSFWEIYPYLPRETRSYVPFFIAATYIMTYHCEHNICPMRTSLSVATDTVMVDRLMHLRQVADVLNVDIEMLRTFNPQYKREIIPGHIKPCVLKLPVAATYAYIDKKDTISAYRADELLAAYLPKRYTEPSSDDQEDKPSEPKTEMIRYTVKSGENLYTIANKYGVTAQNIRKWNNLRTNRVPRGKRLTIYVDTGGVTYDGKRTDGSEAGENTYTARPASRRTAMSTRARTAAARKAAARKKATAQKKSKKGATTKKGAAGKKTTKARKRR